jgi:methyl-accepting chemotaxis protein
VVVYHFYRLLGSGRERARKRKQADETLDGRLDRLARSIQDSARLAEEVSAEVEVRAAAVRELEQKAREAEALAALNQEQAEAVRRLVDASMMTAEKHIHSDSLKYAIASFVAGATASLLVTLLVHPIH